MSQQWPLPERFVVRLTFESDWHVGSGMGRPGNVDRLVTRDSDGLPYVPAKTLCGIWRDACERLCWGLDNGQAGEWSAWVARLFGSQRSQPGQVAEVAQRRALLRIRAARIPQPLRQRLCQADPR
ncbi:MAG: RAMP superfamily CRISPR-associated protein, partial [Gemmataceae bacterium]|nr:RAMP superfamily CRISPR-associated protein [Gemmataceae bacterium]